VSNKKSGEEKPNPLEEELKQFKTRVAQLEKVAADKDKELASRHSRISQLEQTTADRDSEITSLKQSLVETDDHTKSLNDRLDQAVASYKTLVSSANPQIPAELISGGTVEAISDSLAKAKDLVSKVRQGLEAEVISVKVPAGAPERTLPDFSSLSSREKIKYAIGGK